MATMAPMPPHLGSYLPMTHASNSWATPQGHYAQSNMMPMMNVMDTMPATHHHHIQHIQPTQSTPWSASEDDVLVDARAKGLGWALIRERHFQNKTANACRKRHERLMTKRRGSDWDESRIQRLAAAYREMREQMWTPLADRIGERWEHVEKACMQQGLKNLQNMASNHHRNYSTASSKLGSGSDVEHFSSTDEQDHHDDSGIALGGSRRSSTVGVGAMPGWSKILHHPGSSLGP